MHKEVRIRCPACKREYVVDTRTGQVIRELKKAQGDEDLFGDALNRVKQQQTGQEERFDEVLRSQDERDSRLEDAFDEARRRAEENPDEKPYNPMDLD